MVQQVVTADRPLSQGFTGMQVRLPRRLLSRNWPYFLAGLTGLIAHLFLAQPVYRSYDRLLAWMLLLVVLYELRRYLGSRQRSVPVMLMIAFQVYLFNAVPQFSQTNLVLYDTVFVPSEGSLTLSMVLVVAGELAFILGYRIISHLGLGASSLLYHLCPGPTLNWRLPLFFYTVAALLVTTLATLRNEYIPVSVRLLLITIFNPYVALTVSLYLGIAYRKRALMIQAFVLLSVMGFIGFIQGVMGPMVTPLLIFILGRWVWARKFDIGWIALIAFATLIINPVKVEYRYLAWKDKDVSSLERFEDRMADWSAAFEKVWFEGHSTASAVDETASRADDLLPFAQVVDYVPERVPYNNGAGLTSSFLFWVPRVLWPEKGNVSDLLYNRFALEFGYANEDILENTTVAASIFSEGYWNFGIPGVLLFLLASGVLLGFLFGNNGKTESVSTMICMIYVAASIFVLQAITVLVSSMVSFLAGTFSALWILWLASRLMQTTPRRPER